MADTATVDLLQGLLQAADAYTFNPDHIPQESIHARAAADQVAIVHRYVTSIRSAGAAS